MFYIPIHCTWINTRTHKYETYTNYVFCGKEERQGLIKGSDNGDGGSEGGDGDDDDDGTNAALSSMR